MIWGQLSRIGKNLRRQGIMDLAEGAAVRQGETVGIWDRRRCRIIPDGRYGDFFSFPLASSGAVGAARGKRGRARTAGVSLP